MGASGVIVALGRLLRRVHRLVGSMRMFTILLGDMEEEVRMRAIYEMSDDIGGVRVS